MSTNIENVGRAADICILSKLEVYQVRNRGYYSHLFLKLTVATNCALRIIKHDRHHHRFQTRTKTFLV